MKQPFASLVIPTLNRDDFLYNAMVDMLAQDYPAYEIIVVDQSDNTPANVKSLASDNPDIIRYFNVNFRGLPEARNYGFSVAKGDIVIFIDDDIKADNNLISEHVKVFENEEVGIVAGGIDEAHRDDKKIENVGSFNPWTCTPHRGFSAHKAMYVEHVPGGNFSIRKKLVDEIGGVDETLNVGAALYEETELSLRVKKAGYKAFFNPEARLTHLAAATGGCRVPNDIPKYMYGLAHNRSLVIARHLSPAHQITAFIRLFVLGLSYSKVAKSIEPLAKTIQGGIVGVKAGKAGPKISIFK